jgi:hypothetical protein
MTSRAACPVDPTVASNVARAALSSRITACLERAQPRIGELTRGLMAYDEQASLDPGDLNLKGGDTTLNELTALGTDRDELIADLRASKEAAAKRHQIPAYTPAICEVFSPAAIPVIEQILLDGPMLAEARTEDALVAMAKGKRRGAKTTRWGATGIGPGYIARIASEMRSLFKAIVELNGQTATIEAHEALRAWTYVPRPAVPAVDQRGGREPEAPPIQDVRLEIQERTMDIWQRIGVHSVEKELKWETADPEELRRLFEKALEWAETADPEQLLPLFRPMMGRLRVLIFPGVGGRSIGMRELTIGDFKLDYGRGPRPDFYDRAALALWPGKGAPKSRKRPKGIGPEASFILRSFITLRRRLWAAAYSGEFVYNGVGKKDPTVAVRASRLAELPDTAKLITGSPWSLTAISYNALRQGFIGGIPTRVRVHASGSKVWRPRGHQSSRSAELLAGRRWEVLGHAQRPLVMRSDFKPDPDVVQYYADLSNEDLDEGVPPLSFDEVRKIIILYTGNAPHEYRHLAYQMAIKGGDEYNTSYDPPDGLTHPRPGLYAVALVGHLDSKDEQKRAESELARIYGDLGIENAYAVLGLRAGELLSQYLITNKVITNKGARRVQDVEQAKDVLARLEAKRADVRAIPAAVEAIKAQSSELLHSQSRVMRPDELEFPESATDSERLELVLAYSRAIFDQNEEHRELHLKHHELVMEAVYQALQGMQLADEREELSLRLKDLLINKETFRRVPDNETLTQAETRRLTIGELAAALEPSPPALPPAVVRDWHTTSEIADLDGVAPTTVSRGWVPGTHLPKRPDRRPWDREAIPVEKLITYPDGTTNAKFRRVWVPKIKPSWWTPQMREKSVEMRSRWPKSQMWSDRDGNQTLRSLAPLELEEPLASEYAEAHRDEWIVLEPTEVLDPTA